jgi:hypothetical protein
MLFIAGPSVIRETEMAIIEPLDLHIIDRTWTVMPKDSSMSATAGQLQSDHSVVAAKETCVVA